MVDAQDCDCIVLAAGLSSRMPGSKMLREIDGLPLVRVAVEHALAACRRVILVVGHEAEAVRRAAAEASIIPPGAVHRAPAIGDEPPARRPAFRDESPEAAEPSSPTPRLLVVENEHYRNGMFGSIQAGMRNVTSEWFFVAPGDMPGITPALYRAVANRVQRPRETGAAACDASGPLAIVPYHGATRGHPVLVHASLVDRLLAEPRSAGPMRDLLARYPVCAVHLDDPAITLDLDTDDDYRAFADRRAAAASTHPGPPHADPAE